MMIYWRTKRRDDSGVAAIEMALALPLLATFIYGVIVYGYIFSFQQAITQSSAEAARAVALSSASDTSATRVSKSTNAINRVLSDYKIQCNQGGLTCTTTVAACANDSTRNCATVVVTYNWNTYPKVPKYPLLPTPNTIRRTTVIEVS